ncbi:MAG: SDR family NAD(P)-dependent oxidoreductase, partial [Planctomycetota bacterium]|nr:SDR family NAD(P)-dependent oxidoreductase [Planctomycetota bacterium]
MILKGKNVVVTGGGRGIGAAIAHELATEGASLLLGARTLTQVNEVAEAIRSNGGSAWAATCDVTREEDVKAFAATAADPSKPPVNGVLGPLNRALLARQREAADPVFLASPVVGSG